MNIRESIFLNKNEMVSFYWADVEIGWGAGLSLQAPGLSLHRISSFHPEHPLEL
jgi:hypothetical protein